MERPRFSIVVPTRNRPETLGPSLATCLAQDFEDYEIVVCDNSDGPQTGELVAGLASPRIRYLPPPEAPLAMSANWERGLEEARGEYVTVLGDDDGLMPYALRELDRVVSQTDARAVQWSRGVYTWPTIGDPKEADILLLPVARNMSVVDSRDQIGRVIRFEAGGDSLPMIYCAVIHHELIEEHRARAGRVFLNIYPDIYSAFGFAFLAGSYVSLSVPMSLAGLSHASNGVATLMNTRRNAIAQDFGSLNEAFGYVHHPQVPDALALQPVHVADSYLYARDALFPEDEWVPFDRRAMTLRYLAAIVDTDPQRRAEVRTIIRGTLADDDELLRWFDEEAPDFPPAPPFSFRPERFGYDGDSLKLDVSSFGLRDIADAVRVAGVLLGADATPLEYDLPSIHTLRAQLARIPELERELDETRRAGALRHVPRHVIRKLLRPLRR